MHNNSIHGTPFYSARDLMRSVKEINYGQDNKGIPRSRGRDNWRSTSSEIAHDNAVVEALNQGRTIKEALAIAAEKHPGEAIKWNNGNIGDIAAHYEYLKEHTRIMRMLQKQRKG